MPKIISIEKSKTIDYGSAEHRDIWLKREVSQIPAFADPKMEISAQNSVICVMGESLGSNTAEWLFNLAELENRIYILVDSISKDMEENLQKKCLIRRNKNITGSFILDVSKKSGFFFNGSMSTPNTICLSLDKEQAEILYRYFCCSFWQAEPDSPVDVFPNYDNFCDMAFIRKMMAGKKNSAFVPAILSAIDSSKIITSLTGNMDDYVRQIAGNGTRILALQNGNAVHAIENEEGMFIIPKTNIAPDAVSWALKLNETQKNLVKGYLRQIEENADYEFSTNRTRAELAGKDILPLGENGDIRIEHSKQVELKDHILDKLSPLGDFEVAEPENFADDGRSVKITYTWKNVPFYLPHGAGKHKLYADWENEIKKIIGFLDGILQRIDVAKKNESSLAKAISRLFLGKKTKFDEWERKINELKSFDFANTANDKLKEKIGEMNDINSRVKNDIEEIEEENRKAKIDEEIAGIKNELVKKEKYINELSEKQLEETTKKERELEEKKMLLNQLEMKQNEVVAKKEVSAEKPEHEKPKPDKTKREVSEQENAERDRTERDKKEKENITIAINALEREIKIISNKSKNDIDKVRQEINGLNGKIGQKEKEKERKTLSQPKQKESDLKVLSKGQKNNKSQSEPLVSGLKVPDLPSLPKVGTSLWQLNNKDHLAVADWDNFDLGKNEAKRLSATLCAERS